MNISFRHIIVVIMLCLPLWGVQGIIAATWGTTPDIRVEGNHLVNTDGEQVMLHGIMDTPSPYFCGYRFTDNHWIDVYREGDNYINKCINYFDKIFTATTNTSGEFGSWCNVFRLHLDPCWTDNPYVTASKFSQSGNDWKDPHGAIVSGEANIVHFDKTRLEKYLRNLYIPIAKKAQGHGMYVILRPPGVCPQNIYVDDYYQQYLITVWDIVTKNQDILDASGWLSIELANEPVNIYDTNGQKSSTAKRDFFQPIVDKIRANGFKGIIWVPGETWQQNYISYATHPVTDPLSNLGYAVHFYPGWYNTSDTQYDAMTSIRAFYSNVPVVKDYPVMITEVDWSPEDPSGQGHYNESGTWVPANYGTWATGSTSKFGKGYRAVLDYFGNIGMTITHTHDYLDIDKYISTGIVQPRWKGEAGKNYMEACSGACFEWYKEYAAQTHKAREWGDDDAQSDMFPLRTTSDDIYGVVLNPNIWEKGSFNESTGCLTTGQYGFGGWKYSTPLNLSEYKYVVVSLRQPAKDGGGYSASFRLFDKDNYWAGCYSTSLGGKSTVAVPLQNVKNDDGTAFNPSNVYIAGFWTLGGAANAIYIDKVFVSNDGLSPAGIDAVIYDSAADGRIYDLSGRMVSNPGRGVYIVNGKKIIK